MYALVIATSLALAFRMFDMHAATLYPAVVLEPFSSVCFGLRMIGILPRISSWRRRRVLRILLPRVLATGFAFVVGLAHLVLSLYGVIVIEDGSGSDRLRDEVEVANIVLFVIHFLAIYVALKLDIEVHSSSHQ